MHAAERGDYGPLVAGIVFLVISLVPLLDLWDFCSVMSRRVIERYWLLGRVNERLGYWCVRASGIAGLAVACLFVFAA